MSVIYDIECDGCGQIIEADKRGAGYARKRLKEDHSWHQIGSRDYCDACWNNPGKLRR